MELGYPLRRVLTGENPSEPEEVVQGPRMQHRICFTRCGETVAP